MANNRLYIVDTESKEYLLIAKQFDIGWQGGKLLLYQDFLDTRMDVGDNSSLILGHENDSDFYNTWISKGTNYNKDGGWDVNPSKFLFTSPKDMAYHLFKVVYEELGLDSGLIEQSRRIAIKMCEEISKSNPTMYGNSEDLITMIVQSKAYYTLVIHELKIM